MWTRIDTPLGPLRITATETAVTAIEFDDDPDVDNDLVGELPASAERAGRRRARRLIGERVDDSPLLTRARTQLEEYFVGQRTRFDLPLDPAGTGFQQQVWAALQTVPFGTTATYGELAARIGPRGTSARAVGTANGANPIAIVVPCHRVVGADGRLTGYAGGLGRKRALLALEQGIPGREI
ncbi:MAG: methylated-DNA--[protein]-cysteine S-methyltransferase [Acidimicrobiales bacterium]